MKQKSNNKMFARNRALGKSGEDLAARFLSRKGYRIAGRNIKTFVGELDIVAKKGSFIVFVEVKTRKSRRFGPPYLSITEKKKRKLIHCALCYLKMKHIRDASWRIDIVSIVLDPIGERIESIEHFEDAVEEHGGKK